MRLEPHLPHFKDWLCIKFGSVNPTARAEDFSMNSYIYPRASTSTSTRCGPLRPSTRGRGTLGTSSTSCRGSTKIGGWVTALHDVLGPREERNPVVWLILNSNLEPEASGSSLGHMLEVLLQQTLIRLKVIYERWEEDGDYFSSSQRRYPVKKLHGSMRNLRSTGQGVRACW